MLQLQLRETFCINTGTVPNATEGAGLCRRSKQTDSRKGVQKKKERKRLKTKAHNKNSMIAVAMIQKYLQNLSIH